jgi:branched-chain amino acid transport system ATP-binding protein
MVREVTDEALDFVGLTSLGDRLADTLSYGDQRRIEIARALATQPRLLLLDEPTAGMSETDWSPIAELLNKLRQRDITIVVIEHNMQLLERCCNRMAVLAGGVIIAEDAPTLCLGRPEVLTAYFGKQQTA